MKISVLEKVWHAPRLHVSHLAFRSVTPQLIIRVRSCTCCSIYFYIGVVARRESVVFQKSGHRGAELRDALGDRGGFHGAEGDAADAAGSPARERLQDPGHDPEGAERRR